MLIAMCERKIQTISVTIQLMGGAMEGTPFKRVKTGKYFTKDISTLHNKFSIHFLIKSKKGLILKNNEKIKVIIK